MQTRGLKIYFATILFWLLFSQNTYLQEKTAPLHYLTTTIYSGSLQIHSGKIEHFRGTRPYGVDVDWSWKFVSERAYALCQCYPSLGVTLSYRDFGNRSLGHALAALFYVEPELLNSNLINLSFKMGLGLSYLSHAYDEETNPLNLTYSTNFAFPLMIGLVAEKPLGSGWGLKASGTFQHISNGGTSQPNLGINYSAIGLGISKKIDHRELPPPVNLPPFNPSNAISYWKAGLISGLKEPVDGTSSYPVLSLFGEYTRQFARINAWNAGVMGEFDHSRRFVSGFNRSRVSITAGHRFILGRFSFGQLAGVYLWSGHPTKAPWFQYYTLDFNLTEIIQAGVGLKAHGKVAEYLGARLAVAL